MKHFYLLVFLFSFGIVSAQEKLSKEEKERREKNIQAANPFAKYGYKAKVATLSKGKYLEVHDLDSIVTIGTVRFHVDKEQIVGNVVIDSLNPDAQPIGDVTGRWISIDPLTEEFPSWSPYNFVMGNPLRYNDPTGMAPEDVLPPDDHFNSKGQFMYSDNKTTNNIIVHSDNFKNGQAELKNIKFNGQGGYAIVSNIATHYAKEAGVDMSKVHNGKISVANGIITDNEGGIAKGKIETYNDGNLTKMGYGTGNTAIMNTDTDTGVISVNLWDGKVSPVINDANGMKSTLEHEGGKSFGHLENPSMTHKEIYKEQVKSDFFKNASPEYKAHIQKNIQLYKDNPNQK